MIDFIWSQIRVRKFDCYCRQFKGFEKSGRSGEKFARFMEKKCCAATND